MMPDKDELEFINFLRHLVESNRLDRAVLGIAKQTIARGQSSLNPKQNAILHIEIDKIIIKQCPMCSQEVLWSEMFYAIEKGTCAACIPT
jgi:hypothetical protein